MHGNVKFIPLHGILKVSQKMKKVFALLTIVSVLSFVACKNDTKKEKTEDSAAQTEQQVEDQNDAAAAEAEAEVEADGGVEAEVTDSSASIDADGTKVEVNEDGVKVETK